jgi:tetratricopeptide (TPR) repeat protein
MKTLLPIVFLLFFTLNIFGQENKVIELVQQGASLHDEGKYAEAIAKYNEALSIDSTSTVANYELGYTYMTIGQYDNTIESCRKVIAKNAENMEAAYVVSGTSWDLKGSPQNAANVYEEGLVQFPKSNLLNFNLAITCFNSKSYDKAEIAAVKAIQAKPTHSSSHLILAQIMQAKGQRIKAMLSYYYFLMLEPKSKRSQNNLESLRQLSKHGIEQKGKNKINVTIPSLNLKDSIWGPAETMISLLGASQLTDKTENKLTEYQIFAKYNESLFSMLDELKKNHSDFWWNLYVTKFSNLIKSNNCEAFSYYISQSDNSEEVSSWIDKNTDKMQMFISWMNENVYVKTTNQ